MQFAEQGEGLLPGVLGLEELVLCVVGKAGIRYG